ncbi:ABC transporter permease [Rhabdothermincola salaria]|uniref:ABC transporter permease n=1 Tax=Rhabdothermincola salaria TaxID=2903142 RepID=UPI001E61E326|nr:ABC transporter permease [Rhabdothermincola salaria]
MSGGIPQVLANDANSLIWWDWVARNSDDIWERTIQHLELTALTMLIGIVISALLSAVAVKLRVTATPILWGTGLLYTIPSIALFGFLVPRLGLGTSTALVALVLYTLVVLVRNMIAGMEGVPATVREAATGMGLRPWRRFWSVELPLALPTIMAGIRIATVGTVGLVTISALVGEGGYGALINMGLSRDNFPTPIVIGAGLSIVMALLLDLALWGVQRQLTPWSRAAAVGT